MCSGLSLLHRTSFKGRPAFHSLENVARGFRSFIYPYLGNCYFSSALLFSTVSIFISTSCESPTTVATTASTSPAFSLDCPYGLDDIQIDLVHPASTELATGTLNAALPDLRSQINILNTRLSTFVLRYDFCYDFQCRSRHLVLVSPVGTIFWQREL